MKTMYVQEVSNSWVMVTSGKSGDRSLIQISKIVGVRENPERRGACKIVYYNSVAGRVDTFYTAESFDEIAGFIREASSGWVRITHRGTEHGELIQSSKVMGVQEVDQESCTCEITYYDPIDNDQKSILPIEDFEEIAEQLGISFDE